jgi:hypothetical protein
MRSTDALLVIVGAMASHLGCAGLFCIACDGHLAVDGHVYRGLPSENGVIAVDSVVPKQDRVPISGCTVTLEPWAPDQRPKDSETLRLLTRETVTNADGHFATGGTAKPGHYDVTLSVSCPSAARLVKVFRHDRQVAHQVTVILGLPQREGKVPHKNQMQLTRSAMVTPHAPDGAPEVVWRRGLCVDVRRRHSH